MIIDSLVIIQRIELRFIKIALSRANMQGVVLCVPGWIAKKSLP